MQVWAQANAQSPLDKPNANSSRQKPSPAQAHCAPHSAPNTPPMTSIENIKQKNTRVNLKQPTQSGSPEQHDASKKGLTSCFKTIKNDQNKYYDQALPLNKISSLCFVRCSTYSNSHQGYNASFKFVTDKFQWCSNHLKHNFYFISMFNLFKSATETGKTIYESTNDKVNQQTEKETSVPKESLLNQLPEASFKTQICCLP